MKNKVWIIGGSGLVGEAIQEKIELFPDFEFVFLRKEELVISASSTYDLPFQKADILIDLVGPPPPRSIPNVNSLDYHTQFTVPHNQFITYVLKTGIKKYIYISSGGSVYGKNSSEIPFSEKDALNPVSLYGESKKIQEGHLQLESQKYETPYVILRPSNVFNSNVNGKKRSGLIGVWSQKFLNKESLEIFGSLEITKDYIANQDLAIAILKVIPGDESLIFNVGSGVAVTIAEILEVFRKTFKYDPPKIYKPMSDDDVPWMVLNCKKAEEVLNFKPSIPVLKWISTSFV